MIERRLISHLDWWLVGAIVVITGLGLATIYSVFRTTSGSQFWTQLYAVGLGFGALIVCLVVDYRKLAQGSLFIYGALALALLYVLFFGVVHKGARRWMPSMGGFNLQPSEFACIALALVLAMYFGESRRSAKSTGELLVAGGFLAGIFLPHHQAARPRHGDHAGAGVPRRGVPRRSADALAGHRLACAGPDLAAHLLLRAARLPARAHRHGGRSLAGPAAQGLSADPGAGHGRVRGPGREGLSVEHAGDVPVPARSAQRFRLLGAGRGARLRRRAGRVWGCICS